MVVGKSFVCYHPLKKEPPPKNHTQCKMLQLITEVKILTNRQHQIDVTVPAGKGAHLGKGTSAWRELIG